MAGITRLPDELLALILTELGPKDALAQFLSLRLVNKRWARLAGDLVHLTIPGRDQSLPSGSTAHDSHPNLRRWAHNIVRSPGCAQMIKEVVYGRSNPLPAGTTALDDIDELRDALRKTNLGLEAYVARLSDSDPQVSLLVILALSPSLERFHTMRGLSRDGIQAVFDQIARKNIEAADNDTPPCDFLSHLKSIKIGPTQHKFNVAQALTLLTLPRLESLDIHGMQHRDGRSSDPLPSHDGIMARRPINNREHELHIDRIAAVIRQHGAQIQELVLDYTNPWLTRIGSVRHEQKSLGHMIDTKHTVLGLPHSSFARILQSTPAADQTAAIAAILPRSLRKLYILGTAEEDQATPFLALQALMPCLTSAICVPLVEYLDGGHNCRCVDYRAARELDLALVCEQDGFELLPRAGDQGWRSSRSHVYSAQDYYDMVV